MKTEDIKLMASVLKGNIAALEMMNTNEYVQLQQTEEFQDYTLQDLAVVISDLSEILNALEAIQEKRKGSNGNQDILSVAYEALGFSL